MELHKEMTIAQILPFYFEKRRLEWEAGKTSNTRAIRTRRKKTLADGSYKEILRIGIRDLLPAFGHLKPCEVSAKKFEKFCESREGDMANHRKVFNGILGYCVSEEIINARPPLPIPPWDRRIRHVLTKEEIKRLMNKASEDIVNFMFATLGLMHGLRPHERTQLRKDDFDFKLNCIRLRWNTVKTRKARIVPLNSECAPIYQKYFASYDSPFVFPHRDDASRHATRGWYQSRWKKLLRCSGLFDRNTGKLLDITPHDLRATCEKFAALNPDATPVMRKKAFGADVSVQDDTYITSFEMDEISMLTNAVTDKKHGVDLSEAFAKVS